MIAAAFARESTEPVAACASEGDTARAMSRENVDVVRSIFVAFKAGDMDAVRECYDPDVVTGHELEGWPETGTLVGRDAVMRQFERVTEPWDTVTLEPLSIIDAGDRVVARQIAHAVGRGPAVHLEFTTVGTFRSGRIVLVDWFWDHAEALKAVGHLEFTTVGTFRSGRIVLVDWFWDHAEALKAVGLSEQDVQTDS
jgi:ketosteroid isomerase-like protein